MHFWTILTLGANWLSKDLVVMNGESPEAIRLVVWDLDDTLWRGTLVEGRIERIPARESVVRQLAQRGIVSTICSKNDMQEVVDILGADGLWDYFVFPR